MQVIGFPLLLIPLAIYNIIVFLMPGVAFSAPVTMIKLMSGVTWTVTFSDALLALGMLLLMFEVIKAARPGAKYFTDHLLSFLVFAGAAAEFVMLPAFATSTFFLLTVLALVDCLASVAIRARGPRPAVAGASAKAARRQDAPPPPEPKFEPSAATDLAPPVVSGAEPEVALGPEPAAEVSAPAETPAPSPVPVAAEPAHIGEHADPVMANSRADRT